MWFSFTRFPSDRATMQPMSTSACCARNRSPEERHAKPEQRSADAKIYENKCAHPSLEDILNCFCELQCSELVSLFHDLASVLHQAWHAENIELSASIRERFQQDFLEVSDIEALGAEQTAADPSADAGH